MKTDILLLYPPQADLDQPYSSLPYLAASLRANGYSVAVVDLNVASLPYLLDERRVKACLSRVQQQFARLDAADPLSALAADQHRLALQVLACEAYGEELAAIESTLRGEPFYEPQRYGRARAQLDWVYALYSAAHYPSWLTPYGFDTRMDYASFAALRHSLDDEEKNPFVPFLAAEVAAAVRAYSPRAIGISVAYQAQYVNALALAKIVKERFREIPVVLGGAFATYNEPHIVAHSELFDWIDLLVVDEGETALAHYLSLDSGADLSGVPNARFRDARGEVHRSRHTVVEDVRKQRAPDYAGLDLDAYLSPERVLLYLPARGCYHQKCSFCSMPHATRLPYRVRPPAAVAEDLDALSERFGTRFFSFAADALTPRYLRQVAEAIRERGLDIRWDVETRLEEGFTTDTCAAMYEAGCRTIRFGFESASQRVQDLLNKGYQVESFTPIIESCARAGLPVALETMLDFPSETMAEAEQTLRFLIDHAGSVSMFNTGAFMPVLGSPVFEDPERFGVTVTDAGRFLPDIVWQDLFAKSAEAYQQLVERHAGELHLRYPFCTERFAAATGGAHPLLYAARYGREFFALRDTAPAAAERDDEPWRPKLTNAHIGELPTRFTWEETTQFVAETLADDARRLSGRRYLQRLEDSPYGIRPEQGGRWLLWRHDPPMGFTLTEDTARIVRLLDGAHSVEELAAELGPTTELAPLLRNLSELGMLEPND